MHRAASIPLLLTLLIALVACREAKPTRWDEKAAEVKAGQTPKVDKSTVADGGSLNMFFPEEQGSLTRTFTQEKTGFAEAKIQISGSEAKVSISDIRNNPSAAKKFEKSTTQVAGHPLVTVGSKQSALLVSGRWQVKVSSSGLDPAARATLLERFDLAGLASKQ